MMLILTRNIGQRIVLGEDGFAKITVLGVRGNQVRIGIEAPKDFPINREEIYQRIQSEKSA